MHLSLQKAKMKCRMGPNNKAKKGTHVQMHKQPQKMGKERKPHGKNPPPKEVSTKHAGEHEGRKASRRPPKDNFCNPKHGPQLKIVWWCKRFGKDVNNLCVSRNVLQRGKTILNQLTNKVHMQLNMFGVSMLHWVVRNVNGTLIITPQNNETMRRKAKLSHQLVKP